MRRIRDPDAPYRMRCSVDPVSVYSVLNSFNQLSLPWDYVDNITVSEAVAVATTMRI